MSDLSFAQAERRSYALPAVLGFLILAAGVGAFLWRMPLRVADLTVTHSATLPTHTVFPTETRVVGAQDAAEDAFYVVVTAHIHNRLKVPISINDITGSITMPDGNVLTTSAVEKNDLPNVYLSFPKLKPLSSAPLLRESTVAPGGDAEGMVLLSFPIAEAQWKQRKSASVTVELYHQGSVTGAIPTP
jgi:hypothetical protein